jgi:archaemetzincin
MKRFIIFILLLATISCKNSSDSTYKTVLLQPYKGFSSALVDSIKASIETTYGFRVSIADEIVLPSSAFVNSKSPRYRADSLLKHQLTIKPDSIDFILGLTNKDISTTKKDKNGNILQPQSKYADWGIFGLGYRPGKSCIVSTYRLGTSDKKLQLIRLKKICNHELGHNLGLPHCTSSDSCVMRDAAESIKTIDNVLPTLCSSCKGKVF